MCLLIVYGCFYAIVAELSRAADTIWPTKPRILSSFLQKGLPPTSLKHP